MNLTQRHNNNNTKLKKVNQVTDEIERTTIHKLLDQLAEPEQDIVAMLICQLAERSGIDIETNGEPSRCVFDHEESFKLWQAEMFAQGMAATTVGNYRGHVRAFLTIYPNPNERDIKHFLADRLAQTNDAETRQRMLNTNGNFIKALRSFFRFLYAEGLVKVDPTIKLKQPKVVIREKRVPTDDDVQSLLKVIEDVEDAMFVMLLIDCGVRITELSR